MGRPDADPSTAMQPQTAAAVMQPQTAAVEQPQTAAVMQPHTAAAMMQPHTAAVVQPQTAAAVMQPQTAAVMQPQTAAVPVMQPQQPQTAAAVMRPQTTAVVMQPQTAAVMQPQTAYAPQAFPQPAYLPPGQDTPPGHCMPHATPHKSEGQPPVVAGIPVAVRPSVDEGWKTGILDCMDDPMNALVTFFVPCLTFGQIAEIVDDGKTTCGTGAVLYAPIGYFVGIPWLMSCGYRTRLRNKFGLPEAPAPDWLIHLLCESCALCQEYRELKQRGWDPSIGYHGNLARNQMPQPVMMTPINQRMTA